MWILIPAKHASLAKSRLAPVMSPEARAVLARLLLARTLTMVAGAVGVEEALVLSGDPGLRAIARLFGRPALPDPVARLNPALESGRREAIARGATELLVLPTDLPRLDRAALERLLVTTRPPGPRMVIARDRTGEGSNALFLRPATAIPFAFGPGSAARHVAAARRAGLDVVEIDDPALAADLDRPEDWSALVA